MGAYRDVIPEVVLPKRYSEEIKESVFISRNSQVGGLLQFTSRKFNIDIQNSQCLKESPFPNHHFVYPCWISGVYLHLPYIDSICEVRSLKEHLPWRK